MSFSIGQVVDGYELLDYFDSSEKRIAFRARNTTSRRIEQLEILPESLRQDPERSARFFRECRILSTIQHPNILTCHGILELAGRLAISVEAVEAVTLADRLELGPMPIEQAVRSILQLLAAVGAAHAAGVVHREISTAHILITPDNVIKLTGFSAAKGVADPDVTRRGTLNGSTAFTAPEVFQGQVSLDPRVDIYAIGCVFYALVTGRLPFEQTNEFELMTAHLRAAPVPPSSVNPALNAALDAVILKALQKHPADRYQSAGEFFHSILNPGTVYVPPVPSAEPKPEPVPVAAPLPAAPAASITPLAAVVIGAIVVCLAAVWAFVSGVFERI